MSPGNSVPSTSHKVYSAGTKGPITLDQVTPELAAQIVKYFVLPMFDNENKKLLKRKIGSNSRIGNAT
jgi:hypothetical protein